MSGQGSSYIVYRGGAAKVPTGPTIDGYEFDCDALRSLEDGGVPDRKFAPSPLIWNAIAEEYRKNHDAPEVSDERLEIAVDHLPKNRPGEKAREARGRKLEDSPLAHGRKVVDSLKQAYKENVPYSKLAARTMELARAANTQDIGDGYLCFEEVLGAIIQMKINSTMERPSLLLSSLLDKIEPRAPLESLPEADQQPKDSEGNIAFPVTAA